MFFLLYKYTGDAVFDDFPKISDHFPKISEDFPKLSRRPDERSRTFSDNVRRLPKTFEEDPKMFRWYTNEFKYNLRDKLDISEIIDFFTCEDILSFLSICYQSVYHWFLYNKWLYQNSILCDSMCVTNSTRQWKWNRICAEELCSNQSWEKLDFWTSYLCVF